MMNEKQVKRWLVVNELEMSGVPWFRALIKGFRTQGSWSAGIDLLTFTLL